MNTFTGWSESGNDTHGYKTAAFTRPFAVIPVKTGIQVFLKKCRLGGAQRNPTKSYLDNPAAQSAGARAHAAFCLGHIAQRFQEHRRLAVFKRSVEAGNDIFKLLPRCI